MDYSLESFIIYCDDMQIAEESNSFDQFEFIDFKDPRAIWYFENVRDKNEKKYWEKFHDFHIKKQ